MNMSSKTPRPKLTFYVAPRGTEKQEGKPWMDFEQPSQLYGYVENPVCDVCAGKHEKGKCIGGWVCHLCGASGHSKTQCPRRKCEECLGLGHLEHQRDLCPTAAIKLPIKCKEEKQNVLVGRTRDVNALILELCSRIYSSFADLRSTEGNSIVCKNKESTQTTATNIEDYFDNIKCYDFSDD